jgi:hypothetical protein
MVKAGSKQRDVAREFGVSFSTICEIQSGKKYSRIASHNDEPITLGMPLGFDEAAYLRIGHTRREVDETIARICPSTSRDARITDIPGQEVAMSILRSLIATQMPVSPAQRDAFLSWAGVGDLDQLTR